MKPVKGNVMNKEAYRKRVTDIVDYVAECVTKTLGPCGHTALIQQSDSVISTKDGWNVTKSIRFDNIVDNSIKSLIESCGQAVVLRVGDGTTTVIKATSVLNKKLMQIESEESFTIREIESELKTCVDEIITELRRNAIPIDEGNIFDDIYNIAMVSTNWNRELSGKIADIYEKTHNPIIKVLESGTTETTVDIINGYDLNGKLQLPNFYLTDTEKQVCELKNPTILMFNHKVMDKYFMPLNLIAGILDKQGEKLVVLAPDFDATFLQKLKNFNSVAASRGQAYVNMVCATYVSNFNIDKECVDDFAALCGCSIITRDDDDLNELFEDITMSMTTKPMSTEGLKGQQLKDAQFQNKELEDLKTQVLSFLPVKLEELGGSCEKITITGKGITIDGLTNKNEKLVNDRLETLKSEIDGKVKECDALTMLTDDIRQKRIRLGKLQCVMGVIKVGGYGKTNLKAVKDALDDATRACEAAYRDGYTQGSGLAVCRAVKNLKNANNGTLKTLILDAIEDSFFSVFKQLLSNKYKDEVNDDTEIGVYRKDGWEHIPVKDVYAECIKNGYSYDIITEEYDTDLTRIVNPVNVDIEVLQGCLRLVVNCFSSDQFVFTNWDLLQEAMVDENPNIQVTMDETRDSGSAYGV